MFSNQLQGRLNVDANPKENWIFSAVLLVALLFIQAFALSNQAGARTFVHPSIITSSEELDVMRSIAINSEAQKPALERLMKSEYASLAGTVFP